MKIISTVIFWIIWLILFELFMSFYNKSVDKNNQYSSEETEQILNKKFPFWYSGIYDFCVSLIIIGIPVLLVLITLTIHKSNLWDNISLNLFSISTSTIIIVNIFVGLILSIYILGAASSLVSLKYSNIEQLIIKKKMQGARNSGLSGIKKIDTKNQLRFSIKFIYLIFLLELIFLWII